MAGKIKFESGNDFSFDNEMDIPGFSSFGEKQDKRTARSVATGLSKAVLTGALGDQGLTDVSYMKRTLRTFLPKGYGTAFDVYDESARSFRSLYNDTARELRPVLNDVKRTIQRFEEPIDKYLPKSIADRMKKWGRDIQSSDGSTIDPEAQRESMLSAQVAEVFKAQVTETAKREQAQDARSRIREGIEDIRHKDNLGQLNAIRLSVSQLAAYQNNITSAYHRKSLELQFRSYYALRDIVVEQRRMNELTTEAYQKIIKNTGLPEYVKIKESERLKQMIRNKFADAAWSSAGSLIKNNADFLRETGENLRQVVGERVKNFAYGVQSGLSNVESGAELVQMAQDMGGMRPEEILAQGASGMMAQHYGTKAIRALLAKVPKGGKWDELRKKLQRGGNWTRYNLGNLGGDAQEWAQGWDDLPGPLRHLPRGMQEMLRDAVLMNKRFDRTIQKDSLAEMQGPSLFTRQVAKSITEVIPGYLARIFRELQVMRTGDEGTQLTRYDYMSSKFVNGNSLKKAIFDVGVSKQGSQMLNADMEKVLTQLGAEKLSPGARQALRHQLLKDSISHGSRRAEHYMDAMNIESGEHAHEIADHFSSHFGKDNDPDLARRADFRELQKQLPQNIKVAREEIQNLANAGYVDELEELGFIDKHGNIDINKISAFHLDGATGPSEITRQTLRKASRKRGQEMGAGPMRGAGSRHVTNNITHDSSPIQSSYDRSTAGSSNFGEVVEAIKANNNLTLVEKVNATLVRIEDQLKAGLVMYNAGDVHNVKVGPDGRGILDRSLRDNWRAGKEKVKGWGDQAWAWWQEDGWGTAQWNKRHEHMANLGKFFGRQRDRVGGWIDTAKEKWEDMKEVYIEGELKPRLTAWGFKAGMYYDGPITDAKRKLIKSWKDIKGSVYDEEGNLILDPQQAASAFVRTTAGKKLLAVKNWVWDKAKAAFNYSQTTAGMAWDSLKKGVGKAQEYLDAQDVYTQDDLKTPKLQAIIMRAKGYRSMHRRDKFVMTPGDIDGPVVNLAGDQVLTDNDIRTGLCDKYGRPLLTGKLRLIQFGKDTMNMAFQKVQNGWNMAKDFLSGKWQGFKNWFQVDGIAFSGGKTIIQRLTEIRDLLDVRLPKRKKVLGDIDGDGIREGSYEDEVKKGEHHVAHGTSASDAADTPGGPSWQGAKGLWGSLGAGLKEMSDLWKKRKSGKKDGEEGEGGSALSEYGGYALDALSLLPGGKILGRLGKAGRGLFRFGGKHAGGLVSKAEALAARGGIRGMKEFEELVESARLSGVPEAEARKWAEGEMKAAKAGKGLGSRLKAGADAFATHMANRKALAAEAEEIMQAAQAAGMPEAEAKKLAMDALKGGKMAEKVGFGKYARQSILKGMGAGLRGAWNAGGKLYDLNRAGNRATWELAKQGGRLAGRGLWEGAKLGGRGLWEGAKFGVRSGIPWAARNLKDNALNVGRMGLKGAWNVAKFGKGLGAGLALDYGEHWANTHGHHTAGKWLGRAGTALTAYSAAGLIGGILGVGALPVLAVGAAVAGAGYGAYKLYKYATRKKLTELSTLRYIQYGFSPKDEKHVDAIFKLEDQLEPCVSFHGNGVPTMTNKGLKVEDLFEPFGVDIDDKAQVKNWMEWFQTRFKPVFLVHMQACKKAEDSVKGLRDIEKFKPAQKKIYVQVASWPGGPYKYMTSPFPDLEALETGADDVTEYVKKLQAGIEADVKKNPQTAAQDTKAGAPKTVAELTAAATAAQAAGVKMPQKDWQALKDVKGTDAGKAMGASASGAMITMKGAFDPSHLSAGSTLDGISSIRFKTYGLKDMNIEKVKNLLVLENYVLRDISIDSKFVAVYKGDVKKTFAEQAPAFGVDGPSSTSAYDWLAWFNLRFLPTYIAYLTAVCGATKKSDPRVAAVSLKPDDALTVASAVKTASGRNGSVWSIQQMPWPKYEANTDVSSTDENYAGLQERATRSKLDEIKGIPGAGDTDGKGGSAKGADQQSWLGKKIDQLGTGADGKRNWFGKTTDFLGKAFGGVAKTYADGAAAGAYGAGQGQAIQSMGPGTGGSMNSLPDPKGDGSWAAMKDLIIGAAKMVGVDPTLMATMAAIESGFKASVKAGTSTATGLYQFVTGTWNDVVKKYGAKYGITPDTPRTNPKANALMGAEFTKANIETLKSGLGRMPTAGEVYAAHFMGAGTAVKLFKGDQSQSAAALMPGPAAANKNIFFDGGRPRTVGEVIGYLNNLVAKKGAQFGIGTAGGDQLTSSDKGSTAGKPPASSGAGAAAPGAGASPVPNAIGQTGPLGTMPATSMTAGAGAPAAKPADAPAASTGTGAPMGFGGSTGPAPSTASSIGTAPKTVFDAMGGAGKPAAPAPAPTATANKPQDPFAVPNMGPGAAMGTGFSPDAARRASDMVATQRAQAAANPVQVPDGGIAAQQLSVSKEMLAQLQLLVKYASQGSGQAAPAQTSANNDNSMGDTVAARRLASQQSQPLKRAPISMAKPNFS